MRAGQVLADCVVINVEEESLMISCVSSKTIVCGKQSSLEAMGWQIDDGDGSNHTQLNSPQSL